MLVVPDQGVLSLIFLVSGAVERKLASLAPFPLVTNLSPAPGACSISRGGQVPRAPAQSIANPSLWFSEAPSLEGRR